jgi:hypothetical protein
MARRAMAALQAIFEPGPQELPELGVTQSGL